jgi:hypothetical protein
MSTVSHGEFPPYLNPADGPKMAHGAMTGASTGVGGCPDLQNPPAVTGLQHDGQVDALSIWSAAAFYQCSSDAPYTWPSDDASRRRIFERECPYHQGDAAQESPMFRFVEHFPGYAG